MFTVPLLQLLLLPTLVLLLIKTDIIYITDTCTDITDTRGQSKLEHTGMPFRGLEI